MEFLNNINAKSDQKPISLLNKLPFCSCNEPNHQMYTLNMICVEKSCSKKGLTCVMCNYEKHKQHDFIPLINFLDQYQKSYYNFQQKQNKDELKVEKIKEINWETLGIFRAFQEKITIEINNLQSIVRNFSEDEIRSFLDEEENNKDPLIKLSGNKVDCDTKHAMNLISNLLDRIIYKENETVDTENLNFLHSSNEVLVKKFQSINKKPQKNQEIISKKLDLEFENLQKVFLEMSTQFSLLSLPKSPEKEPEHENFAMKKIETFNMKSEFTAFCFFDEIVNNQKVEFLATEAEDNRFKLFSFENNQEEAWFLDLHIKHAIKHLEYCKKLQILIGIDNESNLFTIKFKNQSPFFFTNWTSHHFKDLFSREINTRIVGNYLIVGVNSFIYILNITNEGVIEIKVKIEINGILEFLCEGQNEILFLWNKQNSLKKFISMLEVDKGTIRNLETFDVNYQIKGFVFNKEVDAFVFWGTEYQRNKEFLEIVNGEKKRKCYLEKPIRFLKQDEFEQNLYLFHTNNVLEIVKIVKSQ